MEDQSNPRVQAHAAAALINFTEDCPKTLLIPYLDSLVQHLHVIMVAKLQEVRPIPPLSFIKSVKVFVSQAAPFNEFNSAPGNCSFSICFLFR